MKLYEIANDFQLLFDSLEDMTENTELTDEQRADAEQAWFDTLEGIEVDLADKAENVAVYIKTLKAEADMLKAEEDVLKKRREQKSKRAESLKAYLMNCMQRVNLTKIERPMAKITLRNNAESAMIADEKAFIEWAENNHDELLRYKAPEIAKTEVKKFLQAGGSIPNVTLGRTKSLIIK